MGLMIIPTGYAQVNLKFTGVAVPTGAEVTFGVQNIAGLTADALADSVGDDYDAQALDSLMVDDMSLTTILVKLGPNSTGPMSELGYVIQGTSTQAPAPPNVTALVRKITSLGGRKGRGRMYWPGIPETEIDPGGIYGSAAALQTQMTGFRVSLDASGTPMVLLHNDGTAPTPVTSLNVDPKIATQRRRLRR